MSSDIATIIVNGLTTGCIYGLIGIGFVVVFRATGVVSFAQGAFIVIGALLFGSLNRANVGLALSLLTVAVALAAAGGFVYWLVFSRLVGSESFIVSVATVGLGTLIGAVVVLTWGPETIFIDQPFDFHTRYHVVGELRFTILDLFTLALTAAVFVLVLLGLHRTPVGLRMRAVAGNPRLAAYTGVNVVRTSTLAWAVGGLTAGLAGVIYLLGSQPDPGSVSSLGLAAFPAILLGGLDSVGGSLVGGLLIGLLQASIGVYLGGEWQDVVSYGILLAVLLVRPRGAFGSAQVARL